MADEKTPEINIDTLDDDQLDRLADQLGVGDGEAEADDKGTATAATKSDSTVEEGSQAAPKPEESSRSALTGKELLEQFQSSPEAQTLVKSQLDNWLKQASADADAKSQQAELQKLIESEDYAEIGKRYIASESEKKVQTVADEKALEKAYGVVYGNLFKEIDTFNISDAEKDKIDFHKFNTDEEYVLALTSFIAEKKQSTSVDDLVASKVSETLETLKNMKSAQTATGGSVSAAPGAVAAASNGKETSRSLISEGFREVLEERAESRVG